MQARDDLVDIDGTEELEYWHNQIAELQSNLDQLELQTQSLGLFPSAAVVPRQGWKMSIVNGHLRFETGIRNLSDLLKSIQQASSIRYLSPFGDNSVSCEIAFEGHQSSFIPALVRFVAQAFNENTLLPAEQDPRLQQRMVTFDIRQLIDRLVHDYLERFNQVRALVHASTFLDYYRNLKDPLTCKVTLAMCTSACIAPKPVGSVIEMRQMADFFYSKCKEQILAILDEGTSHSLETLVAINLLQPYILFVRLRFSEARRLLTMAYMIGNNLKKIYDDPQAPLVQRAVFQRNFVHAYAVAQFLELAAENTWCDLEELPYSSFLVLEDESEITRDCMEIYNHIYRLTFSPYSIGIVVSFITLFRLRKRERQST